MGHCQDSWPELAKGVYDTRWHHARGRWAGGGGGVIAQGILAGHRASGSQQIALLISHFVYFFISTPVIIFLFSCHPCKLSLSQPKSFSFFFQFFSPSYCVGERREGVSEHPRGAQLPCGAEPMTHCNFHFTATQPQFSCLAKTSHGNRTISTSPDTRSLWMATGFLQLPRSKFRDS